jgi:hypothetical protein
MCNIFTLGIAQMYVEQVCRRGITYLLTFYMSELTWTGRPSTGQHVVQANSGHVGTFSQIFWKMSF